MNALRMSLLQLLLLLWLLAGGAVESGFALGVPAVVTRPGFAEASGEAHPAATYGLLGNDGVNETDVLGLISRTAVHESISAFQVELGSTEILYRSIERLAREYEVSRRSWERDLICTRLEEYRKGHSRLAELRDKAMRDLLGFLEEENGRSSAGLWLDGAFPAGMLGRMQAALADLARMQAAGILGEDLLTQAMISGNAITVAANQLANRYTDIGAAADAFSAFLDATETGLIVAPFVGGGLRGAKAMLAAGGRGSAAKGGFGAIGFDQLPTGATSSVLRDVYLREAGSAIFKAKLGIQNFLTGGRVPPAQIVEQLATNTEFRLASNIGRSNINLVGGRYVVGGVESSGYFARTVSHHEMMHMAQFIKNPNISTTGFGALRHEIIPSFVGTPAIYGGTTLLIGGGTYLLVR